MAVKVSTTEVVAEETLKGAVERCGGMEGDTVVEVMVLWSSKANVVVESSCHRAATPCL